MNSERVRPLRVFAAILALMEWILVVLTPLVVLLGGLALAGVGTASVSGIFDIPASFTLDDGTNVEFQEGEVSYTYVPLSSRGTDHLERPLYVYGTVEVAKSDIASRGLVLAAVFSWFAGAWVIVRSLRPAVNDALAGRPFEASTVKRLRRVGLTLLVVSAVGLLVGLMLRVTIATAIPFTPQVEYGLSFGLGFIGVAVLGLTEIFAAGQRLEELEASTI